MTTMLLATVVYKSPGGSAVAWLRSTMPHPSSVRVLLCCFLASLLLCKDGSQPGTLSPRYGISWSRHSVQSVHSIGASR